MGISLNQRDMDRQVELLRKRLKREEIDINANMTRALGTIGQEVVSKIKNRAPVYSGTLRESIEFKVNPRGKKKTVNFYSDVNYFEAMDTGFSVSEITPKNKKVLKLTGSKLSRLTKRDRDNVAKYGGIFRKRVKTPKNKKGGKKGPNFFFSGEVQKVMNKGDDFLQRLSLQGFKKSFLRK